MGSSPQLPSGYTLDADQGTPALPKGYTLDAPAPPSYLDEALGAGKRFLGTIASMPSQSVALMQPRGPVEQNLVDSSPALGRIGLGAAHLVTDTAKGFGHAGQEAYRAIQEGQGLPGAFLTFEENNPLIGGMVKHAVSGGPEMFNPQAVGAGLEGSLYAGAPEVAKEVPGALNKVIPSTTRAGRGLNILEQRYASHPVDATNFLNETTKLQQELGTVGKQLPPPLQFLRDRISLQEGNAAMGMPPDPFAFQEARTALKQLNGQVDFRNPSVTDKLYQRAAGALSQDIVASTARPSAVAPEGFQSDYQRMINETRRGNQAIRSGEKVGPAVGALAGYGIGRELGAPLGAEFAAGYIGKQSGKPLAGALMRSVIEREGGPPNISTPPTPPEATTAPPAPPTSSGGPPGGVERRTDAGARAKFAAMSPEQQYQAAYTNHVTGLPNARAFAEAPPSGAYGFSDVAGLKTLNDAHGMAAGDALLKAKAQAMRDAGLDVYHIGGDEFAVRGTDPTTLQQQLSRANQTLGNSVLEFRDAKTGAIERYSGANFRSGIGTTPEEAQAGMMERKLADKSRGKMGTLVRMPAPPPAPME